jgi:hypothetical protein
MNSPDIRMSTSSVTRVRNTTPNRSILLSSTILRDISEGASNSNTSVNNEDMNIFTNILNNNIEKDINLISAQNILHSQLVNSLRNSLLKEIDDTQWMFTTYDGDNKK